MDSPKKFGAPPKREPKPGERFQLGVRVTSELKQRLDAAAEQSGRSQSQEVELRLERSFEHERLLPEVLSIAYGERAAGMLILLGATMTLSGVGSATTISHMEDGWMDDPEAYRAARQAAETVFDALDPDRTEAELNLHVEGGSFPAAEYIRAVRGEQSFAADESPLIDTIRQLLGPTIVGRLCGREQTRTATISLALEEILTLFNTESGPPLKKNLTTLLEKHFRRFSMQARDFKEPKPIKKNITRRRRAARGSR